MGKNGHKMKLVEVKVASRTVKTLHRRIMGMIKACVEPMGFDKNMREESRKGTEFTEISFGSVKV